MIELEGPHFGIDNTGDLAGIVQRFKDLEFEAYASEHPAGYDFLVQVKQSNLSQKNSTVQVLVSPKRISGDRKSFRLSVDPKQDSSLTAGMIAIGALRVALPRWVQHVGGGRLFTVSVSGMKTYQQYTSVKDLLSSGSSGFSSAKEIAYAQGRVVFKVVYSGTIEKMARAINGAKVANRTLRVDGTQGTSMNVTFR